MKPPSAPFAGLLVRGCALLVAGCGAGGPAAEPPPVPGTAGQAFEYLHEPPAGLDLYRPTPEDNRLAPERVALGRRLFFDPVLSRDGTVACASCHRPELGFSDTLRFSPGVDGRTGTRTTPTLLNRAYGRAFFWDGREDSLEETVLRPITNPVELDLPLAELTARLEDRARYRNAFHRAFPDEGISAGTVGKALAAYVRTLLRGNVAADRRPGPDEGASPLDVAAGRRLFLGKAGCSFCHAGPTFTQEEFHNTGVAGLSGDPGRYRATGREEDRGRFKTPTLRGIRLTRPYMHDGSLATLEEVVEFYDRGGGPHPNRSPDLRPLELTSEEIRLLVAFLESL